MADPDRGRQRRRPRPAADRCCGCPSPGRVGAARAVGQPAQGGPGAAGDRRVRLDGRPGGAGLDETKLDLAKAAAANAPRPVRRRRRGRAAGVHHRPRRPRRRLRRPGADGPMRRQTPGADPAPRSTRLLPRPGHAALHRGRAQLRRGAGAATTPDRINAVVLLTDGVQRRRRAADDQRQLDELLDPPAAGSEGENARPVRVFTIGYGRGRRLRGPAPDGRGHQRRATTTPSDPRTIDDVFTNVISNF